MTTEEREALILSCVHLARKLAGKYRGRGLDADELQSAAMLGLVESADRYDPTRGTKFSTTVGWGVRQSVTNDIRNQSRLARIPASTYEAVAKIRSGKVRIDDMKPTKADCVRDAMASLSMRRTTEAVGEPSVLSIVPDRSPAPLDELVGRESAASRFAGEIDSLLSVLDERSRTVVRCRLGLDGEPPHTFRQIGRHRIGMSTSRVQQIYDAAIRTMRNHARATQLDRA